MLFFLLIGLLVARADDAAVYARWATALRDPIITPPVAETYRLSGPLFVPFAESLRSRPGVVQLEQIGTTHGGRPIWAFHVQRPDQEPKHRALVFAGIHALEWISSEVAADLLAELVAHPLDDVRVTVILLLNPDGREQVEQDLMEPNLGRYRRGNGQGVDLNRNFAVNRRAVSVWRKILPGYHATTSRPALSEPESAALDALADRERFDVAVSLHAFGGYLYYPWAGRWKRPDDWDLYVALGREMETAQTEHAYRTRELSHWGFFFRAHGTELDHLYGRYGTLTYLIELTRSGLFRSDPFPGLKVPFRWYNPPESAPHRERGVAAVRALLRSHTWRAPDP